MVSPTPTDADSPPLPPNGIRTTVTFLIFVHFFFLLVSIKSKAIHSSLEQDLHDRAPGLTPYMQLLGMDLSYMFHLTYYDPTDFDGLRADLRDLGREITRLKNKTPDAETPRQIQETERRLVATQQSLQTFRPSDTEFYVEAELLDAPGGAKTILWPSSDMRPGARFNRFQRLVATAVNYIDNGNDGPATMIAKGIADRILAENKSRNLTLRFRRRVIPNRIRTSDSPAFDLPESPDPNALENFPLVYKIGMGSDAGVYEITAIRTDDGGIIVTETKGGLNTAAPSQTSAGPTSNPAPTPNPALTPTSTATASSPATAAPSATATATGAAQP